MGYVNDTLEKIRQRNQVTYEFHEYPKWITRKDGTKMIVQDEYEHQDILIEDGEETFEDTFDASEVLEAAKPIAQEEPVPAKVAKPASKQATMNKLTSKAAPLKTA